MQPCSLLWRLLWPDTLLRWATLINTLRQGPASHSKFGQNAQITLCPAVRSIRILQYIVIYLSPRRMGKSSGNPSISPFPAGGENFVLCRPIIHDFSLKMASPRLPVRARVHHAPVYYSCTHTNTKASTSLRANAGGDDNGSGGRSGLAGIAAASERWVT